MRTTRSRLDSAFAVSMFLILSLLLAPTLVFAEAAKPAARPELPAETTPAKDSQKTTEPQTKQKPAATESTLPEGEGLSLRDNDVYLYTPEFFHAMQRYTAGEVFDFDAEVERLIKLQPHVFSLYFMSALLKVRRVLLAPNYTKDDAQILSRFTECLQRAQRAQSLPKYKDAGLFYETVSNAGLAMFHGIRGNYLKAHHHAKEGMKTLDEILKRRPTLTGAVLLKGVYNFYTGRFGLLTRLLLRLVGIPSGDYKKGIEQIKQAAASDSPLHYFANVYAIYAFAPRSTTRQLALEKCRMMATLYPNNYYVYLLYAYTYEKRGDYRRSLKHLKSARNLLNKPMSAYHDLTVRADVFLLDIRKAYAEVLLSRDEKALQHLVYWSNNRKAEYADSPLIANMYLGHIYSMAGLDRQAMAFYKKMQKFPDAEWMKDLGKRYEDKPMGKRRHLRKSDKAKLKSWLLKHPEVKA